MTNQMEIIKVENELAKKLVRNSPMSANSCIFRVPTVLRQHNTSVFEPNLVSIGPYHRNVSKLQPMQEIKLWYLECLITRAPTAETSLQCFTKSIMDNLNNCLECYAEKLDMNDNDFVEMMVIDGCFLIEFFRKCEEPVLVHPDDPLFRTCWMRKTLLMDLLLLENQLPWFVLDCLFNLTKRDDGLPLPQLAHNFFWANTLRLKRINKINPSIESRHLLDLQRHIILSRQRYDAPISDFLSFPCVKELLQAGIKFKVGEQDDPTKIEFRNGVLTIPQIMVLDNAESLFRNLIAYEQCDDSLCDRLSSYIGFFDNLISSKEDLDHLHQEGIVVYYLSTGDVSRFFNGLYKDAHVTRSPYTKLATEINEYCQSRWPRWRATLSRDYFNSPWSILSVAAAIILLILSFLQTLFTIMH